ncbi:MAG: hypothetical protein CM15mP103_02740 [Gammaproteobacteria bacterium]|nr:MAG: hypothetical protein CM15mP103_02740 [Gammaproteobacteria bacterium]
MNFCERETGFIGFDFILDRGGIPRGIECNPRASSGIHFIDEAWLGAAVMGDASTPAPIAPAGKTRTMELLDADGGYNIYCAYVSRAAALLAGSFSVARCRVVLAGPATLSAHDAALLGIYLEIDSRTHADWRRQSVRHRLALVQGERNAGA